MEKENELKQLRYEIELIESKLSQFKNRIDQILEDPKLESLFDSEQAKKRKKREYNQKYYQKRKDDVS